MKIPSLFFGSYAAVLPRARKVAKRLLESRDFDDFDPGPFLDTAEQAGVILLQEDRLWRHAQSFHCYVMSYLLVENAPRAELGAVMEAWMLSSFRDPWRFLGVMSQDSIGALWRNHALLKPYVQASARHWPVLTAEGLRYGPFVNEPGHVWDHWRSLRYALANLGIPNEELATVPPGGPADFLDRINTGQTEPEPGSSTPAPRAGK